MDRQYNGQKMPKMLSEGVNHRWLDNTMAKRTIIDLENTTQNTKDRAIQSKVDYWIPMYDPAYKSYNHRNNTMQ